MKSFIPNKFTLPSIVVMAGLLTVTVFPACSSHSTRSQVTSSDTSSKQAKTQSLTEVEKVETPPPVVKVKTEEERWQEIRPVFQRYVEKQQTLTRQATAELNQALGSIRVDTKRFASELMGLGAMWEALQEKNQVDAYLAKTFSNHVLDLSQIETAVCDRIIELNRQLIQNDNEFLIECGIDIDFDTSSIAALRPELSDVKRDFARTLPSLTSMLHEAFATNVASTLIGLAAGKVAHDLSSQQMNSDNLGDQIINFLFAAAADVVAAEVTSQLAATETTIATRSRTIANQMLRKLTLTETHRPVWSVAMQDQLHNHLQQCTGLAAKELDVEQAMSADAASLHNQ